jgi:hypothetical protein
VTEAARHRANDFRRQLQVAGMLRAIVGQLAQAAARQPVGLGLSLVSDKTDGARVYRITDKPAPAKRKGKAARKAG